MKTTNLIVGTYISILLSGCGAGALQSSVDVTGVIQGTVVDASSQLPISNATVGMSVDGNLLQTVTNADGAFYFPDVPVNSQSADSQGYRVTVSKVSGYATSFSDILLQRGEGDVPATNTHANTLISLHKASAKIMGTVINPVDGRPISDADITLELNPGVRTTNVASTPWDPKATNATLVPPTTRVKTNENGVFQFVDVPELARYDLHIYKDGFSMASFANVDVPAGAIIDLANRAPDSGATLLLGQGIALTPSTTSSAGDRQGPYVVSTSITPFQDVASGNSNKNISITFSEPLLDVTLSSLSLMKIGYKGESPDLLVTIPSNTTSPYYGYPPPRPYYELSPPQPTQVSYGVLAQSSQVKPTTAKLSDDKRTIVLDVDPTNDENRPLDPGVSFAILGFEGLQDAQRNFFDGVSRYNSLPQTGGRAYLPFSTNAQATLLALSAAPKHVDRTAQYLGSDSCCGGSANLDLDLDGVVPEKARGFRVYVNPHVETYAQDTACFISQTPLSDTPATAISIPLTTIKNSMQYCGTTIPNTTWKDGLSLDVTIAVLNKDGQVGPLSSVLIAKDNRKPEIVSSYSNPDWRAGQQSSGFSVGLRLSEPLPIVLLRDKANYSAISTDGDTYRIDSVDVADNEPLQAMVHLSFISSIGIPEYVAASNPSDTPATATPIPSFPARLTGYNCCGNDNNVDYFSFDGQKDMRLQVMCWDFNCYSGDIPTVEIYFGEVSPSSRVSTLTDGAVSRELPATGKYFLKVLPRYSRSYELTITSGANGRASVGDRLTLSDSIKDAAGNALDPAKNSVVVTSTGVAVGNSSQ